MMLYFNILKYWNENKIDGILTYGYIVLARITSRHVDEAGKGKTGDENLQMYGVWSFISDR